MASFQVLGFASAENQIKETPILTYNNVIFRLCPPMVDEQKRKEI